MVDIWTKETNCVVPCYSGDFKSCWQIIVFLCKSQMGVCKKYRVQRGGAKEEGDDNRARRNFPIYRGEGLK